MPTQLQLRRGNTSQHSSFTGALGEVTVDTDKKTVVVHDGSTAGGTTMATEAFSSNADNLSSGTVNTSRLGSGTPDITTYLRGDGTWAEIEAGGAGNTNLSYTANSSTVTIASDTGDDAVILSGNSTTAGVLLVVDSTSNTGEDIAASANSVKTAFDAAGNAYTNATSYADLAANTAYVNATSYADLAANTAYVNATSYADLAANTAYVNATSYADLAANTAYVNATSYADLAANTAYVNATSYADLAANTAYVNATSYADLAANTAYVNATSYASNADNISSGTLNTARLPATANISTEINVGANVNLTTGTITVGNSTVNSFVTATSIETDGTLNVLGAVTFANVLNMSNNLVSNVATPSNPSDAATKAYVDEVAEGLKVAPAVEVATTGNLSANYDNGTSGVGATLTASANGAFPEIDGVTVSSTTPGENGILVRSQSNAAHNGRYNLTTVGDGSNPWVLTRCSLCDEADEIPGSYIFVKAGTLYQGTGWVAIVDDPSTFTVGTDNITYTQFTSTGSGTAGDFLYLDGTEFNANANSASIASVLVARDADQNFSANVITVNTISATNGTFSGPVSGITTLGTGNSSITGFINVSSTANIGGVLSARANVVSNGQLIVSNTASLGNTTVTGFANISSTLAAGNTTITGFINASSTANIGGVLSARANVVANGQLIVSNTASLGNSSITGFINVSSTANIGGILSARANVVANGQLIVANTASLGNTTVTGFINVSSTGQFGGNVTVTGTVSGTNLSGNGSSITSLNASSVSSGTLAVARGGTGITSLGTGVASALGNNVTGSGSIVLSTTPLITGLKEKSAAIAASAIDLSLGNYFTKTISTTTTFTVSNVPSSGDVGAFILILTNGGSATVTWFSGVTWNQATAPTLTASGVDILGFFTIDGGTTWRGLVLATGVA